MCTHDSLTLKTLQVIGIILLTALILNACGSQPATVSTNVPPAQALPSPTANPPTSVQPSPTSTPEAPVPVKSLDEIAGDWLTKCGAGSCIFEIHADGTYLQRYKTPTETGITQIDIGKITFSNGVFHLESTMGYCEPMPNGFYQASLIRMDGKPYQLNLEPTQQDECADRQNSITRGMSFVSE